MAPELSVSLRTIDELGHISMRVEITPEHLEQEHVFLFQIGQTYLTALVGECGKLLNRFPIRGRSGE